jgi:hypothetical protein
MIRRPRLRPDDRRPCTRQFPPRRATNMSVACVEMLEARQLLSTTNPLQAVPLLPLPPGGGGGGGGGGGQADTTPPSAAITLTQKDPSGLFFDIDVTYTDDTAVDVTQNGQQSNIGNGDIQVSGPDQLRNATLRFITTVSATQVVAHYRVPNITLFGNYIVTMRPNEVQDTSGNFVPAGVLGNFTAGTRPGGGGSGGPPSFTNPDLAVVITKTPSKAATLGTDKITFRLSNLGDFATPGKVKVNAYLSTNRLLDATDPLITSKMVSRVAGGESRKETLKVTFPDVLAGQYYVVVQADPDNVVPEKNETNNIDFSNSVIPVSPPFIDLTPTLLGDLPATVVGGQPDSTKLRITNKGTATFNRTANIILYTSSDGILDTSDAQIATLAGVPLNIKPNGHQDMKVNFNWPTGVPDGNYLLVARVDTDASVLDADTSNNITFSPTSTLIRAPFIDLRADEIHVLNGPLGVGSNVVTVKFSNTGNVPATGNLTVSLSASPTNVPGGGDIPLGQVTQPIALRNGKSQTFRITFSLPPSVARGLYYLHATVDPNQQFSERDETNNDVFTVNPYPTP